MKTNYLEYKGYYTHIYYSAEDRCNYGELEGIDGSVSFDDSECENIRFAFEEAVDDYLSLCEELGIEPKKPYSGRFVTRVPSELHRKVARRASKEGKSLNKVVEEALAAYV